MTKVDIDIAGLKKIATLLNKENLAEIKIKDGDASVRITRTLKNENPVISVPAVGGVASAVTPVPTIDSLAEDNKVDNAKNNFDDADVVKSPIVGTVYLAAQPGADTFINKGSKVKEGDTLLIIEAMKVMNPIAATKSGTVKEIFVSDAEAIEFNQSLVLVE